VVHASKITHSNWSSKISCSWIHNSCFAWVKGVWTIESDLTLSVGAFVTFIWCGGGWECYVGPRDGLWGKQRPQKGGEDEQVKVGTPNVCMFQLWVDIPPKIPFVQCWKPNE
jgi:hypothetical protein